jgi:hypothetical protein
MTGSHDVGRRDDGHGIESHGVQTRHCNQREAVVRACTAVREPESMRRNLAIRANDGNQGRYALRDELVAGVPCADLADFSSAPSEQRAVGAEGKAGGARVSTRDNG